MKIRPVGAELFHADGRTDMTTLTVAFRDFVNAPQKKESTRFCSSFVNLAIDNAKNIGLST
jgi:hypothetical protein